MDLEEETKCPQGKSVKEAQDTLLMVSEDLAQSLTTSQEKVEKSGLGAPDPDAIVEHIDSKIEIQKMLKLWMLKKKLQKSLKDQDLKKPKIPN